MSFRSKKNNCEKYSKLSFSLSYFEDKYCLSVSIAIWTKNCNLWNNRFEKLTKIKNHINHYNTVIFLYPRLCKILEVCSTRWSCAFLGENKISEEDRYVGTRGKDWGSEKESEYKRRKSWKSYRKTDPVVGFFSLTGSRAVASSRSFVNG